jgi:hypothetical protein
VLFAQKVIAHCFMFLFMGLCLLLITVTYNNFLVLLSVYCLWDIMDGNRQGTQTCHLEIVGCKQKKNNLIHNVYD